MTTDCSLQVSGRQVKHGAFKIAALAPAGKYSGDEENTAALLSPDQNPAACFPFGHIPVGGVTPSAVEGKSLLGHR